MQPGPTPPRRHVLWSRFQAALEVVPNLRSDWVLLLVSLAAAYALGLGLHLLDLPKWEAPSFKVDGEYIQATHDAYHWLAGAVGMGKGQGKPMAELARLGHQLLGMNLGDFGFFSPIAAAGLAGAATVLLAWTLGCVEASLLAGAFTVLAPGFFYRTRLGYYDTDMVTLLFPLLLCWGLAHWIRPHLYSDWKSGWKALRQGAGRGVAVTEQTSFPDLKSLLGLVLLGEAARFFGAWHEHIELFGMLLYGLALFLALLLALPGRRPSLVLGLGVYGLCAFLGTWGLAGALLLTGLALVPRFMALLGRTPWPGLALVLMVIFLGGLAQELWHGGSWLLESYGHKTSQEAKQADTPETVPDESSTDADRVARVIWPKVMQSVLEARDISPDKLLLRIHPWRSVALAGLLGFMLLLFFRPLSVFLLPLFILGLSSVMLGGRMAMFAAPVAGLGLALPLCWLGRALSPDSPPPGWDWRRPALMGVAVLATLWLTLPTARVIVALTPTAVLEQAHAQALKRLGEEAPKDAMVWTWWDWGYPTQYYARLRSYADGGQHYGYRIYPLALALTTNSPLQARQVMAFSALQDYEPWISWEQEAAETVKKFLRNLKKKDLGLRPPSKQYFIVTIENFQLLHWISYYGAWNLDAGQGNQARLVELTETFDVDYDLGRVSFPRDPDLLLDLKSADVIVQGELHHWDFPENPVGYHLVIEDQGERYYMMDDLAYASQAVQLLLGDPHEPRVSENFRLVHEGFPVVRIYEVLFH